MEVDTFYVCGNSSDWLSLFWLKIICRKCGVFVHICRGGREEYRDREENNTEGQKVTGKEKAEYLSKRPGLASNFVPFVVVSCWQ